MGTHTVQLNYDADGVVLVSGDQHFRVYVYMNEALILHPPNHFLIEDQWLSGKDRTKTFRWNGKSYDKVDDDKLVQQYYHSRGDSSNSYSKQFIDSFDLVDAEVLQALTRFFI